MTFVDICLYFILIVCLRFVNHLLNYLLTYLLTFQNLSSLKSKNVAILETTDHCTGEKYTEDSCCPMCGNAPVG